MSSERKRGDDKAVKYAPSAPTFQVCRAKPIHVLLVGRSSVGKSTLVRTLVDPSEGAKRKAYSDTRDAMCETLSVTHPDTGEQYALTIIDTPGLQEYRREGDGEKRDDDTLLKLSAKCLAHSITSLHAVCFVSEAGKTQLNDLIPFKKIMDYLGQDFSAGSILLLTNSENLTGAKKLDFEDGLKTDPQAGVFYKYCEMGISFSGCVDNDQLEGMEENGLPMEALHFQKAAVVQKVTKLRDDLLRKLISAAERQPIPVRVLEDCRKEYNTKIEEIVKNKQAQTAGYGGPPYGALSYQTVPRLPEIRTAAPPSAFSPDPRQNNDSGSNRRTLFGRIGRN